MILIIFKLLQNNSFKTNVGAQFLLFISKPFDLLLFFSQTQKP